MQKVLIGIIKVYQYLLSPLLGNHCRFTPSCSQFAVEAVEVHGAIKGSLLSIKRLLSCHPWHAGGYDPVPQCHSHSHSSNPDSAQSKPHG